MSPLTPSRMRALALDLLLSYTLDVNEVGAATLGSATVSNREGQVLLALHRRPGSTPSEVAASLGLSRSAVARLLGRLQQEGFIVRSVDPSDRRSARLSLAEAGKRRIRSFEHGLEQLFVARGPAIRYLLATTDHPANAADRPSLTALDAMEQVTSAGASYVEDVLERLHPYGLEGASDRYAVSLLHLRGSLQPTDLALELRLTSGGVSQLLDRLEAGQLIRRTSMEDGDQRAVVVTLAPDGLAAAEVILEVFGAHLHELCAALAATLLTGR